jgi:uncharacterized protein DUF1579
MAKKAIKKKASKAKPARAAKAIQAKRPKKKAAPPAISQEEMMAAWQKAMTPSEGHRRLEPMVGTFHAKATFVMTPGEPEQVSEGSSEHRWVLGGRWLEQKYQTPMMGMPFEGIGFTGYDNVQGKYVGTWMDSFGTGHMISIGTGKPSDTEIESEAQAIDPSGNIMRFWCKLRIQDHDHHSFEMWTKAPNGRRYRNMLVEYTRQA